MNLLLKVLHMACLFLLIGLAIWHLISFLTVGHGNMFSCCPFCFVFGVCCCCLKKNESCAGKLWCHCVIKHVCLFFWCFLFYQSFLGGLFGPVCEIDVLLNDAESRKTAELKTEDGKVEKHYLFYDGESVSGKVSGGDINFKVWHCSLEWKALSWFWIKAQPAWFHLSAGKSVDVGAKSSYL